ncbi:hypothetical protein [Tellurirhabdus bombi]|uniref:hypothetical protein n=1 Tax=Tellurirhabdus bombi TaxID=2907205 RepID=UPI001F2FEE29|nr:hypothetical protein [Tellurirhabdus bombi]
MATQNDFTDYFAQDSSIPTTHAPFTAKKRGVIMTASVLVGASTLAWGISQITETPNLHGTDSENLRPLAKGQPELVLEHDTTMPVEGGTVHPNRDIQIAHVNQKMSFNDAFNAARAEAGPGGVFVWQGQTYNTYYKEEWNSLSLAQRQEYLTDLGFKPYTDQTVRVEPDPIEPIMMDALVNGHRVIGIDDDFDGIVDMVVLPGGHDREIILVDQQGDGGLDTAFVYDTLSQKVLKTERIAHPLHLSNEDFEQGLNGLENQLYGPGALVPDNDTEDTSFFVAHKFDDVDDETTSDPDYNNHAAEENNL